jgi:hypothetical protein
LMAKRIHRHYIQVHGGYCVMTLIHDVRWKYHWIHSTPSSTLMLPVCVPTGPIAGGFCNLRAPCCGVQLR